MWRSCWRSTRCRPPAVGGSCDRRRERGHAGNGRSGRCDQSPSRHLPGRFVGAARVRMRGRRLGGLIVSVGFPDGAASVRLLGIAMARRCSPALCGSTSSPSSGICFAHRRGDQGQRLPHSNSPPEQADQPRGPDRIRGDRRCIVFRRPGCGLCTRDLVARPVDHLPRSWTIGLAACCRVARGSWARLGPLSWLKLAHSVSSLLIHELGTQGSPATASWSPPNSRWCWTEIVVYRLHRQPEWMSPGCSEADLVRLKPTDLKS